MSDNISLLSSVSEESRLLMHAIRVILQCHEDRAGACSGEKCIAFKGCRRVVHGSACISGVGGHVPAEMVGQIWKGNGYRFPERIDGNVDDVICPADVVIAGVHDTDDFRIRVVRGIPRCLAVEAYFRQAVAVRATCTSDGGMPAAEMDHIAEEEVDILIFLQHIPVEP